VRVTTDALAVEHPIWMIGDSAYDTLDWHDHLLTAGVMPIAPYNPRNSDNPLDIEYRSSVDWRNSMLTMNNRCR
jgi:hypothetical protein